jgi:type II secretory pathway pseudopilin PulG
MIKTAAFGRAHRRRGITLTEILIAILILGVGLASVATLFPLGLLRLRDASRFSRSSYLAQAAAGDIVSRSLLSDASFAATGYYNTANSGLYSPFIQDTPAFNVDWAVAAAGPGAYAGVGGLGLPGSSVNAATNTTNYPPINGPGLPFAYDPLLRFQSGFYPNTEELRFGDGIHYIRPDPSRGFASAYGLQRITNFTPTMLASGAIPSIFVSPEDVVWQEPTNQNYNVGVLVAAPNAPPPVGAAPSAVLPDLSLAVDSSGNPVPTNDFRYSWMVTGQLTNASNLACFDVNVVIFENRSFAVTSVVAADGTTVNKVDDETVVEAIFGHSANINPAGGGYAVGADRTVLLRWFANQPDPVVKAGDWIADVTYERVESTVHTRWWQNNTIPVGVNNPANNKEWDNLPAQRCYWYQVQKVLPAEPDPYGVAGGPYRSMVVYVNQSLQSRTLLTAAGTPFTINAALIAPSVVNVIPQTIFTR